VRIARDASEERLDRSGCQFSGGICSVAVELGLSSRSRPPPGTNLCPAVERFSILDPRMTPSLRTNLSLSELFAKTWRRMTRAHLLISLRGARDACRRLLSKMRQRKPIHNATAFNIQTASGFVFQIAPLDTIRHFSTLPNRPWLRFPNRPTRHNSTLLDTPNHPLASFSQLPLTHSTNPHAT
jgi:hypothetical protein